MPRMFDILRTKQENSEGRNEDGFMDESVSISEEQTIIKDAHNKNKKTGSKGRSARSASKNAADSTEEKESIISSKLMYKIRQKGADGHERTGEIYFDTVKAVNDILDSVRKKEDLNGRKEQIYKVLDKINGQLSMGDSLLGHIYENRLDVYYLPYHIVNTLILSISIGLNIGLNKSTLTTLGMASIFYDVGMDSFRELISQPKRLSLDERNAVKRHITKSLEIVEDIKTVDDAVKDAIAMHHERLNGKGYPGGIRPDDISPLAKILGFVDTYESLSNTRSYRKSMTSHEVLKLIINSLKDDFSPDVIKTFINKMSIYPIGSLVKLNTGEIARVIGVRNNFPLRPIILILQNKLGKPLKEYRTIDLSVQDQPLIKESIA